MSALSRSGRSTSSRPAYSNPEAGGRGFNGFAVLSVLGRSTRSHAAVLRPGQRGLVDDDALGGAAFQGGGHQPMHDAAVKVLSIPGRADPTRGREAAREVKRVGEARGLSTLFDPVIASFELRVELSTDGPQEHLQVFAEARKLGELVLKERLFGEQAWIRRRCRAARACHNRLANRNESLPSHTNR